MVNEFQYCPRLAYLEWVQGEWAESADTVEGRGVHRRVDRGSGELPEAEAIGDDERIHARSVTLSSDRLGLIAKLDLIEVEDGAVVPVDYKRGRRPHVAAGAYEPERVQLCVQGLILEDNGYRCDEGALYFRESRERVRVVVRCRTALEGSRRGQRAAPGRRRRAHPAAARRQPEMPALLAGRDLHAGGGQFLPPRRRAAAARGKPRSGSAGLCPGLAGAGAQARRDCL